LQFADAVLAAVQGMIDDVHGLVEKYIVNEESKVGKTVDVIMKKLKVLGKDRVTLYEIASAFKKLSYGGVDFGDGALMNYPSLWDVRAFLKRNGVKEIYDDAVPIFEVG